MNKIYKTILFLLLAFIIDACGKKKLDAVKYADWVKDPENGLHITKKVGDVLLDVQLKPLEYIALSELKNTSYDKEIYLHKLNKLKGTQYIDIKISDVRGNDIIKSGAESIEAYNKRINYFSFGFKNDIKLQTIKKDYPCILYHYERSYDLSKSKTFILGFEKPQEQGDLFLEVDANELGIGIVKIKFAKENIENIPHLII